MTNVFKSSENISEIAPQKNMVYAPISGKTVKLSMVNDKLIAQELLGKGIAIEPDSDIVYAPISGQITAVTKSGHAIAIESPDGIEVLVHVGINTVELKGKYFKCLVSKGDEVKAGQKLILFDRTKIRKAGYDIVTPLIITNSDDYARITTTLEQYVNTMDFAISVQ